jgi:hypothetical protein
VSAKRSQLHAANLAHMPRYLFEQELRPVCDETGLHKPWQAKPCDVRWKVNFKSNYLLITYSELESTTQALLMALDVTTDSTVLTIRQDCQKLIDEDGKSLSEQTRKLHNLAIDMFYEIVRVTKSNHEDCSRITGQFVQHFKLLYGSGQRLCKIQAEVPVNAPLPSDIKYKYNRRCYEYQGYYALNSATQNMLQALETTKVKAVWARRLELQNRLTNPELWHARRSMATTLWYLAGDISELKSAEGVREQFITFLTKIIGEGQVLVPDTEQVSTPTAAPAKASEYKLNFKSHSKGLDHLNVSTCSLIRKLDAYGGELGALRMYHEKRCSSVSGPLHKICVSDMALALWNAQPMDNGVRNFTKIKDQYLATVEWLYSECGQRLTRVEHIDPPAVPLTSLVAKLYAYLLADTKELHLRHSILELELNKKNLSAHTRTSLEANFVSIAALTCTSYAGACLSDWQRINATTHKELRELLADKYSGGVRR